jgi:hypothetical protein
MHTRILRVVLLLVGVIGLGGCASGSSALSGLTSNPLVSALTSQLGVSPEQAVGGAGAMLGYAKNTLPPEQASAVTNAVPGAADITSAAGPLLGGSPLKSLNDVTGVFSKLGMSPDMVSKFAPIIGDQVSKLAGPQVGSLLTGLFK